LRENYQSEDAKRLRTSPIQDEKMTIDGEGELDETQSMEIDQEEPDSASTPPESCSAPSRSDVPTNPLVAAGPSTSGPIRLITIKIKQVHGESHDVKVNEEDSILNLKAQIAAEVGTPVENQRIVFAGKVTPPSLQIGLCTSG